MDQPQETRFYQLTVSSGLMTPAQFAACWEALPAAKRIPEAVDRRLARLAVDLGYLTRWQAQQLLLGTKPSSFFFDKYVVQALIGQGGMGRVFLAKDQRLGRRVALKVLSRDRVNNNRARARFQREARLGAQLQHDNLVRIYDQGEAGGLIYLVMEYIDGKTVGSIVAERGPLPPALAVRVVYQVALGLHHAHQKGLVHRDVNPMNILIDRDGTAKLTDLGLALDLGDQGEAVTREGATVGTFDYISPEQARSSRAITIRSDIYSLGCTFYHLLAGRVPFPQPSLPEKLYAHQALEPDPIHGLAPTVPPQVAAILQKMMAKRPEERYETPGAVAAELEPYLGRAVSLADFESAPEAPVWLDPAYGTGTDVSGSESSPETVPVNVPSDHFVEVIPEPGSGYPSSPFFGIDSDSTTGGDTPAPESEDDPEPHSPPSLWQNRLLPLVVFAMGLLFLLFALFRGGQRDPGSASQDATTGDVAPVKHDPLIVVRYGAGGDSVPQPDLQAAIQQATDKDAEVVLRDFASVELPLDRSVVIGSGRVVIAGTPGQRPVVRLPDRGSAPAFLVRLGATLVLRNVTFLCAPGETRGGAIIENGGTLTLENCTMILGPKARGMALATGQGTACTIRNCDVRGSDRPLVLDLYASTSVRIDNSLFVAPPSPSTGGPVRWALTTRSLTAGREDNPRRVEITRSSLVGLGLLQLESATTATALTVVLRDSLVQGPALLSWGGPGAFTSGIHWSGQGNRFAIPSGASWVLAADGSPSPDAPNSLETWRAVTSESEASRVLSPAPFSIGDASAVSDRPASGFALSPQNGGPAGIDPHHLGVGH